MAIPYHCHRIQYNISSPNREAQGIGPRVYKTCTHIRELEQFGFSSLALLTLASRITIYPDQRIVPAVTRRGLVMVTLYEMDAVKCHSLHAIFGGKRVAGKVWGGGDVAHVC